MTFRSCYNFSKSNWKQPWTGMKKPQVFKVNYGTITANVLVHFPIKRLTLILWKPLGNSLEKHWAYECLKWGTVERTFKFLHTFFKILKKPSLVQKPMLPHIKIIKAMVIFIEKKQKYIFLKNPITKNKRSGGCGAKPLLGSANNVLRQG